MIKCKKWKCSYLCKECGCNFIKGDRRTNEKIKARKAMCIMLYRTGKMSIHRVAKMFGMCWSLVYRRINEAAQKLPDYEIKNDIKEIEFA